MGTSPFFASAALVLAASFWGLYWWPLRVLDEAGLGPLWSVLVLNAAPVPVAGAILWWRRRLLRGLWPASIAVGVLFGGGFVAYALALVYAPVVRVTMLFYLLPVWGTLLGIFWLGEAVTYRRWMAIVTGVGGLGLMLVPQRESAVADVLGADGGLPFSGGDLLALVAGLLWALATAAMKRAPHLPLHGTLTVQYLTGTAVALPAALLLAPMPAESGVLAASLPLAFGFSCLVILPSLYVCMWCSQRLAPGRVGLLMMSEVVVAVVSASLLLPEESLSAMQWTGGALILGAGLIEITSRAAA